MTQKQIELDHVGPIERLTIPIPEGGGVVVLRGANGVGKSHALTGVAAMYSIDARKDLRQSDGVPSGTIEGPGISIRLGRLNTVKGELVCQALDGRIDPSQLVDPGIKDPLAADARRLGTLIRLAGVQVTPETWLASVGGVGEDVDLAAFVDADPVATADRMRRRIHDIALKNERLGESKAGESAAIEKTVADVDVTKEHDRSLLANNLDVTTQAVARAMQQCEQARSLQAQAKIAQARFDEQVDKVASIEDAQIAVDAARKKELDLHEQVEAAREVVRQLELERGIATAQFTAALNALDSAKKTQQQMLVWQRTIDAASVVNMPSESTLDELTKAKADAFNAAEQGEVIRRALAAKAKAAAIRTEADGLLELAKRQREIARSMDAVLEQALVDAGFTSIKVHDGRLCVKSDRGLEPFSELSMGERWTMALDLAARGMQPGAILAVGQEAWESLDPTNRAFVSSLAKERQLIIVTAEATAGELRAEVFPVTKGVSDVNH